MVKVTLYLAFGDVVQCGKLIKQIPYVTTRYIILVKYAYVHSAAARASSSVYRWAQYKWNDEYSHY